MKKIIFSLAAGALVQFSMWAQPVANATDVATANFTAEFYFGASNGLNPGSAGANQVWDFSGLQLTLAGTNAAVPVAGSPFEAGFPTSNYCYKFSGFGTDRYYYHNLTSSKLEILALALTANSGDDYRQNPRTFAEFPLAYNTVYTDTYKAANSQAEVSFTATYDAYGTLTLPTGTFHNVIRQKIVQDGQTDYIWFNVSPFYPLLQTVLAQNSLGVIKNTTLSIDDNLPGRKFLVYPNPTGGEITIRPEAAFEGSVEITVFDAMGNRIISRKHEPANASSIGIDLQSHSAGMYFVRITDAANRILHSQKLLKK
jgi:hypothetical protein